VNKNISKNQILIYLLIFEFIFSTPAMGQYQSAEDYYKQGNLSYYNHNFESSIKYFELALKAYEQENNIDGRIKTLFILGNCYSTLDNHTKAINYFLRAESLADENNKVSPDLYINIGWEYLLIKDYPNSEKYLKKAYDTKGYIVDYNEFLTLSMDLGFLYRETGAYELSESFFQEVKMNIEKTNVGPIDLVNEQIRFLDAITAKNKTFKEETIIYSNDGKIFVNSNFTTNFNYKLSNIYYFNSVPPNIPEYIKESGPFVFVDFSLMVSDMNKYPISENISDSDIILQSVPFPNAVIGGPTIESSGKEESISAGISLQNLRPIKFDSYEKYVKIIDMDRYISASSFFGKPEINFLENSTIIYWNYSSIITPLQRIGREGFTNRTETKFMSTGDIVILIKPESKKEWSKEVVNINEPVNYDNPPNKFEINRHDTRSPLKSLIPIPISLDTKSDSYIEYVKLDKDELKGPIPLREDTKLEEKNYYTSEGVKNSTLIIFITNTTNDIDIETKFSRDVSENIKPLSNNRWEYNISYFYQVGDIIDSKQTYAFILPKNYRFISYPTTADISRTKEGLEQFTIEYKDRIRFRYLKFTIEYITKSWTEEVIDSIKPNLISTIFSLFIFIVLSAIYIKHKQKKSIRESIKLATEKQLGK
jgi:tetratricopeptide (TPR) repeat protein